MVFDRNEIHIQAFGEIPLGKLMSGNFSSSTFHDFIILSYSNIKKKRRFTKQKILRLDTQDFPKILRFSDSQISQIHIFQG